MKRFHVHIAVDNLDDSKAFYTKLFGAEPAVVRHDYAKWMMDDPRINFAVSMRGGRAGIEHLGLQADSAEELAEIRARMAEACAQIADEPGADCCYARSDKHWALDPQGLAWEAFHTLGEARHDGGGQDPVRTSSRTCGPPSGCCPG